MHGIPILLIIVRGPPQAPGLTLTILLGTQPDAKRCTENYPQPNPLRNSLSGPLNLERKVNLSHDLPSPAISLKVV